MAQYTLPYLELAQREQLEVAMGDLLRQHTAVNGNTLLAVYYEVAEAGSLDGFTDEQLRGVVMFLWEMLQAELVDEAWRRN